MSGPFEKFIVLRMWNNDCDNFQVIVASEKPMFEPTLRELFDAWTARRNFIEQAIREKLDRERKGEQP